MKRSNGACACVCVLFLLVVASLRATAGLSSTTWYVATNGNDAAAGTSWATAKQTIQAAIDAAAASDTVLVSNGVYQTGGRVAPGFALTNRVVINKAVTVQSVNGPAVTTIRGAKDPLTTNGNAAVRCVWMTNGASLAGFTLTNGATRFVFSSLDAYGGGLWAQSSLVSVSNCVLTGNSAFFHGGGVYGGTLYNCMISGNRGGSGGGASFADNPGTLNNCSLIDNSANDFGGGAFGGTLNNCLLTRNSAKIAGGAYIALLINSTIAYNSALNIGGGTSTSTQNNCIVYFNTAPFGTNYNVGSFNYTCTQPDPGGPGNITSEPLFTATNDFRLAAGSPGINAGDNALAVGATDLAGFPRILGVRVDMGAYEMPVLLSVTNTAGISIPTSGNATPYPSTNTITGVTGPVGGLRVRINGLSHSYASDIDAFLVSPTGQVCVLFSDAGLDQSISDVSFTLDDLAADVVPFLPGFGGSGGRYRPANHEPGEALPPGGSGPIGSSLNALVAGDVNGIWKLFVSDDSPGDGGGITSWTLELDLLYDTTNHFVNISNPTPAWPYATWTDAATNIQDAIDAAAEGDTVLVSNGVYQTGGRVVPGSLLTNRVIIDKPITLRSVNGAAATTIRGNDPLGDAAVRCVWMTDGATLVGFTLTNGATRNFDDSDAEQSGGGVWAQSASAVVSNCTLTGNSATSAGGAYRGTLNNCTLAGNTALNGPGGGAYGVTLNNCMLTGNSAFSRGGGAFDCTMNNCTLTDNSAFSGGGSYDGTMNNCIVYFNLSGGNYDGGTINHTCTTPDPGGIGIITSDPLFVNAGAGNYRLLASSPCVNVGNNVDAPGAIDLDGNPRIALGTVDMGAYEYDGSVDRDTDGFTDAEEYIADTQPTNTASFFPDIRLTNAPAGQMSLVIAAPTSPDRFYGVYANTNLLQSPQAWTLVPPEQTGNADSLTLTLTNNLPAANYRTGVRLP